MYKFNIKDLKSENHLKGQQFGNMLIFRRECPSLMSDIPLENAVKIHQKIPELLFH